METINWSYLPDHIVVNILSYLTKPDRFNTALACKAWNTCMNSVHLWKNMTFRFDAHNRAKQLQCLNKFGRFLKSIYIEVEQDIGENRVAACLLIRSLSMVKERRFQRIRIRFTRQNPCLYAGQEFLDPLYSLFGPPGDDVKIVSTLREVNLSGLKVNLDAKLLDLLSANNADLEKVNIQNNVIVCKVNPSDALQLVHRCRKLKELQLFSFSCDESLLLALAEDNRAALQHLSIFCRREQKYLKDISSSIWNILVKKLPCLRVTLAFDHTCPLYKVSEVMKPEIPVSVLRLETYTDLQDEIRLACSYYKKTLEKLIVQSPPLLNHSHDLNDALLDVIRSCPLLRSLHVFCVLEKETVEEILSICDYMRENKTYTLKFTAEPHPWIAGKDFW